MERSTRSIRTVSAALTTTAALALVTFPATAAHAADETEHTVRTGDTVWDIARKYQVSVNAVLQANGLDERALIQPGQVLVIPGSTAAQPTASTTHRVVAGDTVWDLARAHNTSVSAIIEANGLGRDALIRIGQMLVIPGGSGGASSASPVATSSNLGSFSSGSSTYVVVAGDTLSSIASRYGTTVSALAQANGIENPSLIRIGQKITVPGGTPTGLVGDTFLGRTYPEKVVAAANQNKATLNAMDVPTRSEMQALVVRIANEMGVDPALAQAIAYQESGFNQRAVSPANAIGTMQVIPSSGEWASDIVGRDLNLLDPVDNVTAGVAILKTLLRNGTELDIAIAGYYQGETSVRNRGMNEDTKKYVASVKALMERFQ